MVYPATPAAADCPDPPALSFRSTTVSVYFNANQGGFSYCDEYSCTVSGYLNEYVEGKSSLSLCQVQAGGAVIHDKVPFASSGYIPLTFDLPEVGQVLPPEEAGMVPPYTSLSAFLINPWRRR